MNADRENKPSLPGPCPGPTASLSSWLAWLERLHPAEIDLGLDRLRPVAEALDLTRPAFRILTVAGTNGKGSSVALAEALLRADGCRTGAYTSPHLLSFNERIRIDGEPADDAAIVAALAEVERHRGDHSLSYFEYTTLAALLLFRAREVDHAVLEVGLGGRLDAVNIVDADVALLTRVALDHAEWLGNDLAGIAREKAGVCRPGRPAVIADPRPDSPLPAAAAATGADVLRAGEAFSWASQTGDRWAWQGPAHRFDALPGAPWWRRPWQRDNASGALAAVACLRPSALRDPARVARVLAAVSPAGRVQGFPGRPEQVLDVAHNPDAALALADWLASSPVSGRTRAVLGMKADKDVAGVVAGLEGVVDEWWPADLSAAGGLSAKALGEYLPARKRRGEGLGVVETWQAAGQASHPQDRLLVLGSFLSVGPVLRELQRRRHTGSESRNAEAGSR